MLQQLYRQHALWARCTAANLPYMLGDISTDAVTQCCRFNGLQPSPSYSPDLSGKSHNAKPSAMWAVSQPQQQHSPVHSPCCCLHSSVQHVRCSSSWYCSAVRNANYSSQTDNLHPPAADKAISSQHWGPGTQQLNKSLQRLLLETYQLLQDGKAESAEQLVMDGAFAGLTLTDSVPSGVTNAA